MLSNQYKCIFIHIPKTAGQSIERFFLRKHGLTWAQREALLLKPNKNPEKGPERLAHLRADEYVQYSYIDKELFCNYFKFSFVRNPWERLVSEYWHRNYYKSMSFRKFVLEGLPAQNSYSDAYRHILPQYDFLHDDRGVLLVDYIGRFENLQDDFNAICAQLDILNPNLPHANSSKHKKSRKTDNYMEYYDQETRDYVARLYEKDIDCFQYVYGK